MADEARTAREIERNLERERAELRRSLDEIVNRLTFEDAWERTGFYLRDNRAELGQTLGRMIREKPVGFALTLFGLGLMFFGPSQAPSRRRESEERWGKRPENHRDPYALNLDPDLLEGRSHDPNGASRGRQASGAGSGGAMSSADDLSSEPGLPTSSDRSNPTASRTYTGSSAPPSSPSSATVSPVGSVDETEATGTPTSGRTNPSSLSPTTPASASVMGSGNSRTGGDDTAGMTPGATTSRATSSTTSKPGQASAAPTTPSNDNQMSSASRSVADEKKLPKAP